MMERKANVIVEREDGLKFDISQYYKIASMTGFGDLNIVNFTEERVDGDGVIITGERIAPREPALNLVCEAKEYETNIRKITNKFFNKGYKYKLFVTYNNNTEWLNARLQFKDLPTGNCYKKQSATLSFICPDPYYHSVDAYDQNIAGVDDSFGWPTYILQDRINKETPAGVSFGYYNFNRNVVILNDGDFDSYFKAMITANTDVTNFKLLQDEETFVKINGVLKKGTIAWLDLEQASLYIKEPDSQEYVRSDNRISRDSTFFKIPVGESIIKYSADIGEENVSVKLTRYLNYSGI